MAERLVTSTVKDIDGDVIALAQTGEDWSPRAKHDAIVDIELGLHSSYVPWPTGRTDVRVARGPAGKYLCTDRDGRNRNNLNDLPA